MARAAFGLTLYPQDERYNQAASLALSFTAADLVGTFEPVENNLKTVNDAVVSRSGGSSAQYTQPAGQPYAPSGAGGVGVYNTSPTLNVETDSALPSRASWLVHLGTVDADRHPQLMLDLRRRPGYAHAWANITIGDRITATGAFSTGGQDADVVVEGWDETLSRYVWQPTANCSPNAPWRVFVVGDSQLGRVDARGSTLAADAAAGATSLTVAKAVGQPWTTTATRPGDFPFDVEISGIQVTVTAIVGATSPQTFTVTGVTKALHANDTVRLWRPGVIAL